MLDLLDSRISGEVSDVAPTVSRFDTQTDRSDEESSDRAELSAELSSDISDRAELSADFSELSVDPEKYSCEDTSVASFDPTDRPQNCERETTALRERNPTNQNTASLSSNSSFENISIAEIKKD